MTTIFTRRATVIALAGAAMLATGATQAIAAPRDPAAKPVSEVSGNPATPTEPSMQQRYCVQDAVTGSRIAKKTCKTRSQWIVDGWDPAKEK